MIKKKVCPVCEKPYLKAALVKDDELGLISQDHYYHVVEKLFGINHYAPSGLCVVGSMKMGKDIDNGN